MRGWCLALVLGLLAASAARGAELKVATWNLNWLSNRDTGLPADVRAANSERQSSTFMVVQNRITSGK